MCDLETFAYTPSLAARLNVIAELEGAVRSAEGVVRCIVQNDGRRTARNMLTLRLAERRFRKRALRLICDEIDSAVLAAGRQYRKQICRALSRNLAAGMSITDAVRASARSSQAS